MQEKIQAVMAYVRYYGSLDEFIAFTCNPEWPEIKEELFPHQILSVRLDLIVRVFHQIN